jgi:glycosyltransferase involved in cell wall biosynthesis
MLPRLDVHQLLPDRPYCRVLLIGPMPPPHGGVSTFLRRSHHVLTRAGHQVQCIDTASLSRRGKLAAIIAARAQNFDLIQVNVWSESILGLLWLLGRADKVQFVDHGWRMVSSMSRSRRRLLSSLMARLGSFVVVGEHLLDMYREYEIELPKRVLLASSYIPPVTEDEPRIIAQYPAELLAFIDRHRPVVIANAFQVALHEGIDLYGLDMCVELLSRLRRTAATAGLVIAFSRTGDEAHLARLRTSIADLGLAEHVFVFAGDKEIWPLFRRCHLMVRPTATDGYGLSIAEALSVGCPAVASDVCARPRGALIFASRDIDDFERKCREALCL